MVRKSVPPVDIVNTKHTACFRFQGLSLFVQSESKRNEEKMKRKQEDDIMESDDGMEGEDIVSELPQSPVAKKLKTKEMDREFSIKEISKLKEAESLFQSSILRMQISELLKNVSLKQKFHSRIESAVKFLSKKLLNLPSGKEYKISDRSWLDNDKINVPLIEDQKDTKGVFQFSPPVDVRLIGSVSFGTSVKPRVEVDLALLVPKNFFESKDILNRRFQVKKALYLAALASRMSKYKKVINLDYDYHTGNPLRPVLIVTFKEGEDSMSIHIRLHILPESHPFKLSKLHISKNNAHFKKSNDDTEESKGTKYYNSSILQDLCLVANEECIKDVLSRSEGLQQGIMLLKIWLNQRELSVGHGMFSHFLITAYVASLTKAKKLNKMMNGLQVFKTTLLSLSKSDWQGNPPSLCVNGPMANMPSMEDFRQAFDCVFVDCTGCYNLAYSLSGNVLKRVQVECQASLGLLEQSESTVFEAMFMATVPFVRKFDHIFHVPVDQEFLGQLYDKRPSMKDSELDMGASCRILSLQRLMVSVLSKALRTRVTVVQAKPITNIQWPLSCKAYKYDSLTHLTFGLTLDQPEAYNILNKGPPADAEEARQFRAFWGEKSEMRRFKDGTIHEAVLWSTSSNQSDKRIICKNIVLHILNRHCGVDPNAVVYQGNPLDPLLEINPKSDPAMDSYGTGEEYSLAVLKAFEQVNRMVRLTSDLPLSITSVQGVHPVFRHAEVFPPLPTGLRVNRNEACEMGHKVPAANSNYLPPHIAVLPVVCGLESSGKWPDDKEAMRHMKVLLHVKLGQELKDKFKMCVKTNSTYIDVYQSGFVFRLMLACARELVVLRTVLKDTGVLTFEDTEESLALERDTVDLPLLSHLIHSVQQEHYAFSATVRLCKRWLAAQMVWNQLRDEVLELVVASVFINPHPYSAPASPCVGLMRFLHLFSTFDWKNEVLMVNLQNEFSEEDYSDISQHFKTKRNSLPAMCIATPKDKKGDTWTKETPERSILDRLVMLAGASLRKLESQVMTCSGGGDFKIIFRPVLENFDLVIQLRTNLNVCKYQAVDSSGSIFVHSLSRGLYSNKNPMPVLDFNVYQKFLQDLHRIYGHLVYFFFDRFGGNVIGMVWKTQELQSKDFKVSNLPMSRPVSHEDSVSLDLIQDCIVGDIKVLGSGIIDTITNHRQSV